jgi:crotonobetainyl-CoA:carnitine CoA-transferase CaiB-like acyl-CoA transferase
MQQPRDDWASLFATVDCCVTPILAPEEALKNEQLLARNMIITDDDLVQFAPPLKLSGFNFAIHQPAPDAGEHNAPILQAAGYSDDEIAGLKAAGVLG